jgi:hypothetical protein
MQKLEGKIAAILDRSTVVVNRGSDDGVSRNDVFWIYSDLGPFFDPDTQENLGVTKKIWGKVVVSTVEKRFCLAKTEYQTKNLAALTGLANLFGTTIEQIQLPVEESEISRHLTKVGVGSKAMFEKHQKKISEKKIQALPAASVRDPEAASGDPSKD